MTLREKLLENAAKNMQEWYPGVKPEEIMGEYLLRQLFKSMLEDESNVNVTNRAFQTVRQELVDEINAIDAKAKVKP